jgi:hypothetical protein
MGGKSESSFSVSTRNESKIKPGVESRQALNTLITAGVETEKLDSMSDRV